MTKAERAEVKVIIALLRKVGAIRLSGNQAHLLMTANNKLLNLAKV